MFFLPKKPFIFAIISSFLAVSLFFTACDNGTNDESTEPTPEVNPDTQTISDNPIDEPKFKSIGETISIPSGSKVEEIQSVIFNLTSDSTIKLNGGINSITLKTIAAAMLENDSVKISLDLSETTGISEIKDWFKGIKTLYSINLPKTVTAISNTAFMDCSILESIGLTDSIVSIGNYAFEWTNISEFAVPDSVIIFGTGVLNNCKNLTKLVIGKNISELNLNCSSIKNLTIKGVLTKYSCSFPNLETLYLNSNVLDEMFKENASLKDVYLGDNCGSIGRMAFYKCSSLQTIKIPKSCVKIGQGAFYECKKLMNLENNAEVTSVENYSFYNCTSLSKIKLNNNITTIGQYAFYNCPLEEIIFPEKLTKIDDYSFYKIAASTINIPENVMSIGKYAFSESSVKNLYLNPDLQKIDAYAFCNCKGIEELEFRTKSLAIRIEEGAFSQCTNLKTIYAAGYQDNSNIGYSLDLKIGKRAFEDCSNLISVDIEDEYKNGCGNMDDYAFNNCGKLTTVKIPSNFNGFGKYAFLGCNSLNYVSIEQCIFSDSTKYVWVVCNYDEVNEKGKYSGTEIDTTTPSKNATYLKSTYNSKYWRRNLVKTN